MEQHTGTGDRDPSAAGIRALYFPQDGSLPLVPHGRLPTASRKGAPAGEVKARKRMHHLLKPDRRASAAEERALREAGIPLLPREDGGHYIDPGVERVSDEAAAMARVDSAVAIAALYGLTEGSSALVPHGVLPTLRRKDAPAGEVKARRRMHNLLTPESRVSVAEERVLREAGIALLRREDGSFCIDPGVARESDEAAATARFDSASAIAELYGLTEGSTALVPHGVLPTLRRKDAPAGEVKARRRMHDLLKPEYRVSAAEERVLRDAGIPLLRREDGSFCIAPGVVRESGVKRAGSSAVPALPSGQRRPVAAPASSLPVAEVAARPAQLATGAAGAAGAAGDPFLAGGREGSHGGGPGSWLAGSGLPPGTGMAWTQDGIPLGQGDDIHPAQPVQPGFPEAQPGFPEAQPGFPEAQPGFAEGRPGFAEVLSGGPGDRLGPVVCAGVDGWVPGGFGGGSVDTVSGASGVSGFWSAPVNPAVLCTGGYPPGAAWDIHPPGTDTLTQATQELAAREPAVRELGAWELGVVAPVYPRTGHGVAYSPRDPATAYGRAGYAPAVADGDAGAPVPGQPATPAAGAYLPQGLPVTLGTRTREDSEQPVQGMQADRVKRSRIR
ncbi:hypothetical protein ACJ6WF_40645 [Streptomyces sp. MMS24-I2-30]|uniref:hypothetical protein n=1 Tax=Streptomyces sp. MMS24-I2-30 TaxID=3351564 RepID=UPI003896C711